MITVNPHYLKQCCGSELTAVLLFHTIDWYCAHKYSCFLLMIWIKKSSILIFYIMLLYVFLDIQQLLELGAALKKHCDANDSSYMPKVGELCCAMCPGETPVLLWYSQKSYFLSMNVVIFVLLVSPSPDVRKWYRAMLNDISETAVSVNCVDYGRKMKLPKENLRPITPSFLTLPFQAVRCSLAGTVSVEMCSYRWYRIVFFINIQL